MMTPPILVVDDEPITRKIMVAMLASIGLAADTASDGQRALSMVPQGRYRVLLLDLQMPEMDGYQTAAAIRDWERQQQLPPLAIVGMTAASTASIATAARTAGIDTWVSKPLQQEQLAAVLQQWLPLPQKMEGAASCAGACGHCRNTNGEVWERETALNLVGGDADFLDELIAMFLQRHEGLLGRLAMAVACEDAASVRDAAHAYKGTVHHFAAEQCQQLALQLEMAGKNQQLQQAGELFSCLQAAAAKLVDSLQKAINRR